MFCSHCGKAVTVGAKFCPNCGAAIENQPAPTEGQPKAPTMERAERSIKSGTRPGKGKKRAPKPLVIVVAALALFIGVGAVLNLLGDDNKPDSNPGEGLTENVPYREFNAEEFLSGDVITGTLMYMGSDEGGELSRIGNAIMVSYKTKEFKKNFSDVLKNNDATWETIKKCLEDDWFNSESKCVELDYIGEVEWKDRSYDYFRLNVTDLSGLNSRFESSPDWTSVQEIYVIAEVDKISDSWADELGEQIQQFSIQFFINQFNENISPISNQSQPKEDKSTLVYEDSWTGNWDEIGGRIHMTIAPTTTGYDIVISGANGAADMVELRLTGEGNGNGGIACFGEEWNIHYPDGGGDPVETLVNRDCAGTISDDADYLGIIMYNDLAGKYNLTFVYEGESLPDSFSYDPIEEDDGIPYVDAWAEILGTIYEPKQFFSPLGNHELAPHFHASAADDVTYYVTYSADSWTYSKDLAYGVRDGYIVAYMALFDFPEVHTMLSSDFDGIEPKIIINDNSKYLIWEVNNGYVIFEVGHSERGYLYDLVMYMSCFTDKEMCSLLMEN